MLNLKVLPALYYWKPSANTQLCPDGYYCSYYSLVDAGKSSLATKAQDSLKIPQMNIFGQKPIAAFWYLVDNPDWELVFQFPTLEVIFSVFQLAFDIGILLLPIPVMVKLSLPRTKKSKHYLLSDKIIRLF